MNTLKSKDITLEAFLKYLERYEVKIERLAKFLKISKQTIYNYWNGTCKKSKFRFEYVINYLKYTGQV